LLLLKEQALYTSYVPRKHDEVVSCVWTRALCCCADWVLRLSLRVRWVGWSVPWRMYALLRGGELGSCAHGPLCRSLAQDNPLSLLNCSKMKLVYGECSFGQSWVLLQSDLWIQNRMGGFILNLLSELDKN